MGDYLVAALCAEIAMAIGAAFVAGGVLVGIVWALVHFL